LQEAVLSDHFIQPEFSINYTDHQYEVTCNVQLPANLIPISNNECESPMFFQHGSNFYIWKKPEDILLVEQFLPTGKLIIAEKDWSEKLTSFILPISKNYPVHFANVKKEEVKDVKPELKILLKEKGEYPAFSTSF
jgi:hypothetical protein